MYFVPAIFLAAAVIGIIAIKNKQIVKNPVAAWVLDSAGLLAMFGAFAMVYLIIDHYWK